jgi:hypothetical protein
MIPGIQLGILAVRRTLNDRVSVTPLFSQEAFRTDFRLKAKSADVKIGTKAKLIVIPNTPEPPNTITTAIRIFPVADTIEAIGNILVLREEITISEVVWRWPMNLLIREIQPLAQN